LAGNKTAILKIAGGFIRKTSQVALRDKPIRVSQLKQFSRLRSSFKRKLKNNIGYIAWKTKRFTKRFSHILIKPTRQVAHATVVLIILTVFSTSVFANAAGISKEFIVDPFGIKTERQTSEVSDMQVAATVAEVFGAKVSEDAASIVSQKLIVSLPVSGSSNFLAKPALASTSIPENRKSTIPISYVVEDGDTLWSIAVKFDITTDTIIWANNLEDEDLVKPGQSLTILPVPGVLHTVKSGDSIAKIANKYGASESRIMAFNDLESEVLSAGVRLIVPDGKMPETPKPAPQPTTNRNSNRQNEPAAPRVRITPSYGGPNNFPWGYCTWWVASRRSVPWSGNAWQWYYNAQGMGYSTGKVPAPGSIMVSWESPIGHVAYVESVNGDSFTISEMNYQGYGIVNRRTVSPGGVPLIGFIY